MRRHEREGIARHELQGILNRQCDPENHLNERGFYVPHLVSEGWQEFNKACYALRRYMIFKAHASETDRRYAMHDTRYSLAASQICARPVLP